MNDSAGTLFGLPLGVVYVYGAEKVWTPRIFYAVDPMGACLTVEEAAKARDSLHCSHPVGLYEVDTREQARVTREFGFRQGSVTVGVKILRSLGPYYNFLPD